MSEKSIEEQEKILQQYTSLQFVKLRKIILQDLNSNYQQGILFQKYSKEQIAKFLSQPDKYEKELRKVSRFMYIASSHYRRLIDYFSNLATFNYSVISNVDLSQKTNVKIYKEIYYKTIKKYEKYNIKSEIPKILNSVFLEGIFCGIYFETKDSFFIKPVDSTYTEISSIEDGVPIFSFDLNYFNTKDRIDLLSNYGTDFVSAYELYKGNSDKKIVGDKNKRWFEPKNQICVKYEDNNLFFSIPVFSSLFSLLLDLELYEEIKKDKASMENYKVLAMQMDVDKDGVPTMEFNKAKEYYQQAASTLPEGIGLILSPFKINDFSLKNNGNTDVDYVEEAESLFWNNAGVSSLLFGMGKTPSSNALGLSIRPDEAIVYKLLNQIAKAFNLAEKKTNPDYLFQIQFLEQSIFSVQDVFDRYSKAATYGIPCKLQMAASLGMTPSEILNSSYIEDNILKITKDIFKSPLISSNTQSSIDNTGGRPSNSSQGLEVTEVTETQQDNGSNVNR